MRTGFGLAVGVLAAVLAGSGCCKLCDWCCCGSGSKPRASQSLPPVVTPEGSPAAATGANRLPPASQTMSGVPVGAYGGSGN